MLRVFGDLVLPPEPPVEPEVYDPTKLIVILCAVALVVAAAVVTTVVLIRKKKHRS